MVPTTSCSSSSAPPVSRPCSRALAIGARVVVIGVGSGSVVEIDLKTLMGRRAGIRASTLRARPSGEKAVLIRELGDRVVPALAEGRLRVPVAATFALADAAAAYERFSAGGKLGKIVLVA